MVALTTLAPPAFADNAASEIGTAVLVKKEVVATLGEDKRDLPEGSRVHQSELLETGNGAQVELKLDDETKLALGPNASLKLDEFVISKSDGVTTIGVNFLKGTFRFITGSEKKEAYRIETPSATVGVRGTVFDVYVDGTGDTLVLLHEGEVDICTKSNTCRRHNSRGRIVHATLGGVLSEPIRFTTGLIPGVSVGSAFPFVGKVLRIDPIRRLRTTQIIERPVKKSVQVVKRGARGVKRAVKKVLRF
ncbi:MAG: FecR domain-containing protein [Hyphomicrobium sp.]|nr:FecR domain-containing protein [Hyphomicrobium sp.]